MDGMTAADKIIEFDVTPFNRIRAKILLDGILRVFYPCGEFSDINSLLDQLFLVIFFSDSVPEDYEIDYNEKSESFYVIFNDSDSMLNIVAYNKMIHKIVVNTTCCKRIFVRDIILSCEKIFKSLGFFGHCNTFECHESIDISKFIMLKSYVLGIPLPINRDGSTNYKKELEILSAPIE